MWVPSVSLRENCRNVVFSQLFILRHQVWKTGLLTVRSRLKVSSISERKLRVSDIHNISPRLSEEPPMDPDRNTREDLTTVWLNKMNYSPKILNESLNGKRVWQDGGEKMWENTSERTALFMKHKRLLRRRTEQICHILLFPVFGLGFVSRASPFC